MDLLQFHNQLKILKIVSEGIYEIEGGPNYLDRKRTRGSITRTKLLEKVKWDSKVKGTFYFRKEGETRLLAITNKLIEAGLIRKIPYTEKYVNNANKTKTIIEDLQTKIIEDHTIRDKWLIKKNYKEIRFEITVAGRRQARDEFMF